VSSEANLGRKEGYAILLLAKANFFFFHFFFPSRTEPFTFVVMKRGREGDGDEYVVNTRSFVNARASEIQVLSQEVADKKQQRIMQQLPFHKQRRQMTFSAKRMPKRVRDAASRELALFNVTPKPFRHRAYRRRPRYLAANFAKRQRPQEQVWFLVLLFSFEIVKKWLPTHVWHAKRFSSVRLFGLVLPLRPFDRASRAAAKTMLRQCAVYDSSAHRALVLGGVRSRASRESLLRVLSSVGEGWSAGSVARGGKSGATLVYDLDKNLVAPVSFVWRSDSSSVMIWVHKSALEQLRQLLQSVVERELGSSTNVVVVERDFARFDLLGPESFAVLRRVLRPLDGSSRLARFLAPSSGHSFIPERICFESVVNDPRFVMAAPELPVSLWSCLPPATLLDWSNNSTEQPHSCIWGDEQQAGPPRQNDIDTRRAKVPLSNEGCNVLLMQMPRHEDTAGENQRRTDFCC
jgi:ribonuclease P/MRP protein subunit POP1